MSAIIIIRGRLGADPVTRQTNSGTNMVTASIARATLKALARAIQTRRMRERSEVPSHYTAVTVCAHCGPVPIFPGVAEQVQGCPWCFNRTKGLPIPKAPTKTETQDLGPAMIRRKDRDSNHVIDYAASGKVRVGKRKPEASDE